MQGEGRTASLRLYHPPPKLALLDANNTESISFALRKGRRVSNQLPQLREHRTKVLLRVWPHPATGKAEWCGDGSHAVRVTPGPSSLLYDPRSFYWRHKLMTSAAARNHCRVFHLWPHRYLHLLMPTCAHPQVKVFPNRIGPQSLEEVGASSNVQIPTLSYRDREKSEKNDSTKEVQ